jgi:mobilization protein MobC
MTAEAFIQCRVTPAMKTLVRALAEREQITESALVKQLLEVVLRTAALEGFPNLDTLDKPNRDARLYVRLDPDDRVLLTSRASARGMRAATYVSVLVRSHLRKVTPIPKDELAALKGSIAELRAIGINLNQMARAANQGKQTAPGREELQAMLKVAEGLRDHFKALLVANEKSWEQGHAEEPH